MLELIEYLGKCSRLVDAIVTQQGVFDGFSASRKLRRAGRLERSDIEEFVEEFEPHNLPAEAEEGDPLTQVSAVASGFLGLRVPVE